MGRERRNKEKVELDEIFVEKDLRGGHIGSNMLKLMISYFKDKITKEIYGEIYGADNVEKAKAFYIKNQFEVRQRKTPDGEFPYVTINSDKIQNIQYRYKIRASSELAISKLKYNLIGRKETQK